MMNIKILLVLGYFAIGFVISGIFTDDDREPSGLILLFWPVIIATFLLVLIIVIVKKCLKL